ncbi:MAG: monophosphatase [Solirubrobacteraceae bacterium]|nr:monophosphatase [Solirubrobacteraceae bacterium]
MPRDVLDVATEAARAAGAELIARYRRPPEGLGSKQGPADLVSDADRAAERAIAAVLGRRRPDDGVLGEEGTSNRAGTTGLRWVVDPLDGTSNYLAGLPFWCVSIACEDAQGTLAGVVLDPLRDERFAAVRGCSVQIDGPVRRASAGRYDLEAAMITGGVADKTEAEAERAGELERRLFRRIGSRRALGTAALELAWTAAGRIDICYHEQRIHPWDVDAGLFICHRAGLRVHRLEPVADDLAPRYLAAPQALTAELLSLTGPGHAGRGRNGSRAPLRTESVAAAMRRRER